MPVQSLVLPLAVEALICTPVVIDAHCAQVKERLSTLLCPTHAGLLHTILNNSAFAYFSASFRDLLVKTIIKHR